MPRVLLISTYDLGRQPFGLASPAAWLGSAGAEVALADLSRDRLDEDLARRAQLIGVYVPMHTATRLALPVLSRVRALAPSAIVCAYGLYAPLSERTLREHGADVILGPEFEADIVALARRAAEAAGEPPPRAPDAPSADRSSLARLAFIQPDRAGLPPLTRYATLQMPDGTRRVAGATEATRGCKHRCRHCPIVPVYDGHFRVVPVDVVVADVMAQAAEGAHHITFGDPDFLNGPAHARRIVERLHEALPALTYDVTIKVEHLLKHRDLLPVLAQTGCLFVTSAVESFDDEVLRRLEKGHTRRDVAEAVALCRQAGLTLVPTFVAFTPWTTLDSYGDLLATVEALDLVEHVAPVQWTLRLLVTQGSRLLELDDLRTLVRPFDPGTLTYPWRHPDPRVDDLQQRVSRLAGVKPGASRSATFHAVGVELARARGAVLVDSAIDTPVLPARATIPYLNEPWYC